MGGKKSIASALSYFAFFSYPPTLAEIATFYLRNATILEVRHEMGELVKHAHVVQRATLNGIRYAYKDNEHFFATYNSRYRLSLTKMRGLRLQLYIELLSFIPSIAMVAISGSLAMMNAVREDDVDFFIITAPNRMWSARFWAVGLSKLLGIHRSRGIDDPSNKVCLNLFFDMKELVVPKKKQHSYVAHEILQMKQLVNKGRVFEQFLAANKWVSKIYPNSKISLLHLDFKQNNQTLNSMGNLFEKFVKKIQLYFINKHKTTERVTSTQLWFFPDDFEKKIHSSKK